MTFDEIFALAATKRPLSEYAPPEDEIIYIALENLITMNALNLVSVQKAKETKIKLRSLYAQSVNERNIYLEKTKREDLIRQKVGTMMSEFMKSVGPQADFKELLYLATEIIACLQGMENNQCYVNTINRKIKSEKPKNPKPKTGEGFFERFYMAYPRKVYPARAKKAFDRLNVDEELLKKMLATLEKQKKQEQWQNPSFIPHPSTWLNGSGWLNEVAAAPPSGAKGSIGNKASYDIDAFTRKALSGEIKYQKKKKEV